jgi:hypothetical protein
LNGLFYGKQALLREREQNDPTPWLREQTKQMADKLEARGMTPPLPGVKP